jgi:hypothetical protein
LRALSQLSAAFATFLSKGAGMQDFALIDRDHDLDPLRERQDFQKLVAEVQAKAERPPATAPLPGQKM